MTNEERIANWQADRQTRVKNTAEVFTPPKFVKEMLALLPDEVWEADKTFCDPACGNGNFLVEVLKRKLDKGHPTLAALLTIYGVDIVPGNVWECRFRLLKMVVTQSDASIPKAVEIVCTNIVLHDALTYDFNFEPSTPKEWNLALNKLKNDNPFDRLDVPGDVPKVPDIPIPLPEPKPIINAPVAKVKAPIKTPPPPAPVATPTFSVDDF